MIDEEGDEPGEGEGVEDSEPSPDFSCLAAEGSYRRYTREIEQDEEQERERRKGREACGRYIAAIEDSESRDDGFLGRQTGEEADGHLPIEAKRLQERRDGLADGGEVGVLEIVEVLRGEVFKCPDDDRCPEDDGTDLLEVVRHALPYMRCRSTRLGQAELRQLVDGVVVVLPEPRRTLHDDREKDRETDTYRVEGDHDEGFVIRKESIYEEHIYRQPCGAGHERHHEHRQHAVLRVLDVARRHDRRYVAPETHEHRHERTSVKTDAVHDGIHDKRLARHVARVLHEGDEEEKDDDIRQEGKHGSYALQHAVDEQTREPAVRHVRMSELAERVDAVLYPRLRISAEGEGAPEHEIQHCHHDREAEPGVGQNLVDLLQTRPVRVVLGVSQRLGEDTMDVGAVGVVVALIAEVVDRVRRRKRLSRCVFYQRQALLQTIVLLRGDAAGGYTDVFGISSEWSVASKRS